MDMIRQVTNLDIKEFMNNIQIISESGKTNYKLNRLENENSLFLWYKTGPGQFKVEPIIIPKSILLDDETFIIFGLIQAETYKNLKSSNFQFINSNPELITRVLIYFVKKWKISINHCSLEVTYWRPDFENKKAFLEGFWKDKTKINNVNIRKGTEYRLSNKAEEYGVASLRINNRILTVLMLEFHFKVIRNLVENNNDYLSLYLRGLFEGDGILGREKGLFRYLGLAFNPESDELFHYKKLLRNIGLDLNLTKIQDKKIRCILFGGWNEIYKFLKITNGEIFLDREKNKIIVRGFLTNQYVIPLLRLRKLARLQEISTVTYATIFKTTKRSAIDCLKRLCKLRFLECNNTKKCFSFRLTNKGKEFLDSIKSIEGVLNDY